MMAQAQRPRSGQGWLVVTLMSLGHCLAKDMQQRLSYPHLQERSQWQQIQMDFYPREVICSFFCSSLASFFHFVFKWTNLVTTYTLLNREAMRRLIFCLKVFTNRSVYKRFLLNCCLLENNDSEKHLKVPGALSSCGINLSFVWNHKCCFKNKGPTYSKCVILKTA